MSNWYIKEGDGWVECTDDEDLDGSLLESREDVEAFIAELREVADRVFGSAA